MSDQATAEQLEAIRFDFDYATTLTDEQIQSAWYRVRGAADEITQHEATIALIARSAMMSATKLRDNRTGNTEEKMSQVFDHLKAAYTMFKSSLDSALGANASAAIAYIGGAVDGGRPADEDLPDHGYWGEDFPGGGR